MFFKKYKGFSVCLGNLQYYDDPIGGIYPTYPWGETHSIALGRFEITFTVRYSEKKKKELKEKQEREERIMYSSHDSE
jgi:hypothetical protein